MDNMKEEEEIKHRWLRVEFLISESLLDGYDR